MSGGLCPTPPLDSRSSVHIEPTSTINHVDRRPHHIRVCRVILRSPRHDNSMPLDTCAECCRCRLLLLLHLVHFLQQLWRQHCSGMLSLWATGAVDDCAKNYRQTAASNIELKRLILHQNTHMQAVTLQVGNAVMVNLRQEVIVPGG